MIGVVADPRDRDAVREFFELFKTPWEVAVRNREYAAVLCCTDRLEQFKTSLVIRYGSERLDCDREGSLSLEQRHAVDVDWQGQQIPIYGRVAIFSNGRGEVAAESGSFRCERRAGDQVVWRIGYDLFREVHHLLTEGQPVTRAATPTLELHIALLRALLVQAGVFFVEIPPIPSGHAFTCCLTHDIDFFGIRRHRFDRTIAGFVARASVGTLVQLARRRRSFAEAVANWKALLSLPFTLLGFARDFWAPFEDYARAEAPSRSTFFLVPFKNRPGLGPNDRSDRTRAVRYQVSEIPGEVRKAASRGSELAIHGIDAWRDANAGQIEMTELTRITAQKTVGVRMHWLYFASDSPRQLEEAGFDYDSTWGYNEAVGYRAGTSQVFRFPATQRLLELPLSIMDSALLSPSRMSLTSPEAIARCESIVENATRFGGTVVVNWHCRSLAPERLWAEPYRQLLECLRPGAWFAKAAEAVNWFRWRRSIEFTESLASGCVRVHAPASCPFGKAGLIRIHRPGRGIEEIVFDGTHPHRADFETATSATLR